MGNGPYLFSSHNFLISRFGEIPKTELIFVQCKLKDGIGEKHFSFS